MIDDTFEMEAIRTVSALVGNPDPDRRLAAHAELMSLIGAQAAGERALRRQLTGTRRKRLPVPAWSIGALSGVAAAVIAAVILIGHGGAVQPPSAAAAVLERAAKAPALVSPLHLGPHQYWYVEDSMAYETTQHPRTCQSDCYETRIVRWWVGPSRYSMHQYVTGRPAKRTMVTKAPPNVPMVAPPYSNRWSGVGGGYDQGLHYKVMLTIPTNVGSLRKLVSHLGLQPDSKPLPRLEEEQVMFGNIQGILLEPRVPARMLSGLYRLLATLPGARLVGPVTDSLGRPAIEVAYTLREMPRNRTRLQYALLFDPKTYVLLDVVSTATGKYPSYEDLAYVNSGLVKRIGGLPKAPPQW